MLSLLVQIDSSKWMSNVLSETKPIDSLYTIFNVHRDISFVTQALSREGNGLLVRPFRFQNKKTKRKKGKNESEKINCYKYKSYLGPFQVFSSVIDCKLYPREHISGLELENIWKIFHLLVIGRSGPSPPQLSPSPGAAAINERSSFPGWYARPIRRPTFIKEARGSRVSFVQHRHPGIVTSPGRWSSARKPVPSSTGFLCRLSPFYEDTKRSWTPLSAFRAACTVFGIAVELILEAGPDLFPRSIFEMWEEGGESTRFEEKKKHEEKKVISNFSCSLFRCREKLKLEKF